jgi:hypothetical protein
LKLKAHILTNNNRNSTVIHMTNAFNTNMSIPIHGFKEFYERHKYMFPYNEVCVTHCSIYSKWLLVEFKSQAGIMFYTGRLFVMLSQTMEQEIVQHLIYTRKALPLPEDLSTVMDCMYFWGRTISFQWYQYRKMLELCNFYLRYGDIERTTFRTTDLYHDVICIRVLQCIYMSFAGGNATIYDAWSEHYSERINSGETDFFMLAVSSFQFLSNEMTSFEFESQYHAESSVTVVSNID